MTKIEWTEATWNPIVGCSIVSPGCTHCYAMGMAARLEAMARAQNATRTDPHHGGKTFDSPLAHYLGTTQPSKAGPVWTGKIALAPDDVLSKPLRPKKPTMWFVNSMGDLFHEDVPDEWILLVLDVIRRTSYDGGSNIGRIGCGEGEHTYQVLTKRSARMRNVMSRLRWDSTRGKERLHLLERDDGRARVLLKNLWLGVSAERQQEADARIPDLVATPAAVRFVSAEPLLGAVDLWNWLGVLKGKHGWTKASLFDGEDGRGGEPTHRFRGKAVPEIDWVIVGGESGRGARPMHPDWVRTLRDQCQAAGVPFFFKQWGEWAPTLDSRLGWRDDPRWVCLDIDGMRRDGYGGRQEAFMRRVGKRAAGAQIDGHVHREWPRVAGRAAA